MPRVGIYASNHAIEPDESAAGGLYARPIRMAHKVWIGAGVRINPGVSMGDGAIIGAGSIVAKDIPKRVLAADVPCKVLRSVTETTATASCDRGRTALSGPATAVL